MSRGITEKDYSRAHKYYTWLSKKVGSSQNPMAKLQYRTMSSALATVSNVETIPFEELSASLYFFCADIEAEKFTRQYEAQLELAGANPDRFIRNLHAFYSKMAVEIKKNNLFNEFFDFLSGCARLRYESIISKKINATVVDTYLSLLLQQMEYLRPDKYDFRTSVCGITLSGELMVTTDPTPTLDNPAYEMEEFTRRKKSFTQEEYRRTLFQSYKNYGYDVHSLEEIEALGNADRCRTNHIAGLASFLNEYTFDMLPTKQFGGFILPFYSLKMNASTELLVEVLKKRKATLPSNGVRVEFKDSFLKSLLMKETLYNDTIYLLYRLETSYGDFSGYYDTRSGYFHNLLIDGEDLYPYKMCKNLVLYLYASQTTRDGNVLVDTFSNVMRVVDPTGKVTPLVISGIYGKGGKIKDVYTHAAGTARKGNARFTTEERAIQGFIRKVGKGKNPSEQAREYAKSLGLDLALDETFVRPFVRTTYRVAVK